MKKFYFLFFTVVYTGFSFGQTVFINEIHYQNQGSDVGEGVEIAGPAGTDLSTYTITAYDGTSGATYKTTSLSGVIPNEQSSGYGTIWFDITGLQNGTNGIALDNSGALIQFLSYGGSFSATDGPANGISSTDIGVSESSTGFEDESLQLISSGDTYGEFTWAGPVLNSPGSTNVGQTFTTSNSPSLILYDGPPNGATFVGDPETPNPGNSAISFVTSHFVMSSDAGGGTGTGGDGFIKWYGENTSDNTQIDGGNIFTSNDPLTETPINGLVAGQTYFFRAELVDNSGASLSSPVVYSFTITIATYTDVANLTTLRSQTVDPDLYYRVTGSVINTFTDPYTGIMFFQDGTAGIQVNNFNYDTQNYTPGDALSNIRGHLELANGMLQLVPSYADWGTPTTTGNIPSVSTATIATLLSGWESYESQLVKINVATFADAGGTFAFNQSYNITDSSGTMAFTTPYNSLNYIGSIIPSGNQNLVVLVSEISGTPEVTARSLDDFTLGSKNFESDSFKLFPNPTYSSYVTLQSKINAPLSVSVFDLLGKQVFSKSLKNNTLDVSLLRAGIYLVKISQDNATITKKLVVR